MVLASVNFYGLGSHLHRGSSFYVLLFISVALFPKVSDAVFCYNCMVFQCNSTDQNCNSMKTFAKNQLAEYYVIGNQLPPLCPEPSAFLNWTLMQLEDSSHCTESCVSGNIKITSSDQGQTFESRATILGCAKLNLIEEITIDLLKGVNCRTFDLGRNLISVDSTGLDHVMTLRRCSDKNSRCNDRDFCVEPNQSLIGEWIVDNPIPAGSWRLVVLAVIVVLVLLIFLIGCNENFNTMIKDCCTGMFSRICIKCGNGSKESYDLREQNNLPLQSP